MNVAVGHHSPQRDQALLEQAVMATLAAGFKVLFHCMASVRCPHPDRHPLAAALGLRHGLRPDRAAPCYRS